MMEYSPLYIAVSLIGLILLLVLIIAGGPFIIFPILGIATIIIFGFEHWILALLTFVAVIYAISTINPRIGNTQGYKTTELVRVNIISSLVIIGFFIISLLIN